MVKFLRFLRRIKKSFLAYKPVVEVLIYKENLLHNLNEYKQKYPKLSFAPVLKSNAYGHGLVQIAKILDKEPVAFLVVDSLFEAMALRHEDVRSHILIVGYTSAENISNSKISNIAFTITSLEQLKEINKNLKKEKKFHLKIDTGMHRQGIMSEEISEAMGIIQKNKFINLEGVCSHLADADSKQNEFTNLQIKEWQKSVNLIKQNFSSIKFFHLSATAGLAYADKMESNVARLGIGLYGINVGSNGLDLKPVLEMQSIISSIKTINEGDCVGYNMAYKADKKKKIATVPVGYFEGVDRRLSNVGDFIFEGKKCPIVGKISMNITSIDASEINDMKLGDKISVISRKCENENSVVNIAKLAHTIPYEILVHIPQHLRRIVK